MRKIHLALAAAVAVGGIQAHAATLYVGSTQKYKTISAAASAAVSGDTIAIYPGTYAGATISDSNVLIRKTNSATVGQVVITGATVGSKGLFLVKGSNVTVDGLRFTGAKSSSRNGAGIRLEGQNLTVRNSEFISNETGMLITPLTSGGFVTVSNSLFKGNGYGDGQSHGLYANRIAKLTVADSRFEGTKVGHHLKSRAEVNVVTGSSFVDTSMAKAASYQIELPEGGTATIENNTLVKGKYSSNSCCSIALGFEQHKGGSYVNPTGPIIVRNNRYTNERSSASTFVSNRTGTPATLTGNTVTGLGRQLVGVGSVDGLIS